MALEVSSLISHNDERVRREDAGSSHTRWGNELLPLSLRIDFRTVPYAHIPVTVCLRRQGAAGQPAPPPFASCTRARRGRCCSRPDRVGYYLDRRCLDQSLKSSCKTPLVTFPTFLPPQALKMVGSFSLGGARKKRSPVRCKTVKSCGRSRSPWKAQPRPAALSMRLAVPRTGRHHNQCRNVVTVSITTPPSPPPPSHLPLPSSPSP